LPTNDTPSSNSDRFRIAETDGFRKQLKKNPDLKRIYKKISEFVYPLLRENPYYGPNIKRLRENFSDFYRYRIGNYRLFYAINDDEIVVLIVKLEHRQSAYK
jgi:mRNA interferase RelE/StbE